MVSDHALCLRFRDGDELAFRTLLDRHRDVLFHQVNQFGADGESRDDFEQAARVGMLKAAKTFSPERGRAFRGFLELAVRAELITLMVYAKRGKNRSTSRALRLEQPWHGPGGEIVEFGSTLPARPDDDPCEIVIRREKLHAQVEILHGCSLVERTVVARRLSGQSLRDAGTGVTSGYTRPDMGAPCSPERVADNALMRVRRKLQAAA